MKILLIGNDRDIVYMTSRILKRNQYEVICAIGQLEISHMLEKDRFDLVMIDCDMSESDCKYMIKNVKEAKNAPLLLIISGNREDEVPFLKLGADDWIHKPYQMEVLLTRMAVLLRQKKIVS